MANPIAWVRHTEGGENITVPCPSSYQFDIEDVSQQGAGRTEDVTMNKKQIGQVSGITVEWRGLTTAQANAVLKAFNPEYIYLRCVDPLNGTATDNFFVTREVYTGNRSSVLYDSEKGLWESIKFKVVDRKGKK